MLLRRLRSPVIAAYLCCCFAANTVFGEMGTRGNGENGHAPSRLMTRAEEFFSEEVAGETLISVHLLGAVARAGVYHVPRNTDIVHLVSLAGGTRAEADLSEVSIKRRNKAKEEVIGVNLEELTEEPGNHPPVLQTGDIVLIKAKQPIFERDTVTAIAVLTSLISVLASVVVLIRSL